MEFSQRRERLSTKSITPDDDVFSTPGSSFFGRSLLSSPRIDSTPPTSEFLGSGHNTPVHNQRNTSFKSLNVPWGIGLDGQEIKLESTPPPSSQLPAAYESSPTPTPKSKRGTPNAVRAPPCCQTNSISARRFIEASADPNVALPDEAAAYHRWATVVRNALVQHNMWKFVDGSHSVHSATLFYRNADYKTVELIRWAYTTTFPLSNPALLDDTLHMPAPELWDYIRAKHTSVAPSSSWASSASFSSADALPPTSSAATPPSDHFGSNAGKVWFLMHKFHEATLAGLGHDAATFANQLQTIAHRLQKLGFALPEFLLKMQFLKNLEPEYAGRVRELEEVHGPMLWEEGGVGFAEVRECIVGEERRLREAAEQREKDEVVREELERLEGVGVGVGVGRPVGDEARESARRFERVSFGEERRRRAEAAEQRLRAAKAETPELESEELQDIQESVESNDEPYDKDQQEQVSEEELEPEEEQEEDEEQQVEEYEHPRRVLEIKDSEEEEEDEEVQEVQEEELAQGSSPRVVLQVKDTPDKYSDAYSSDEDEAVEFLETIARHPTTPDRTSKQKTPVEKVQETPIAPPATLPPPPSSNRDHQPQSTPIAPARVAKTLGTTPTPRRTSVVSSVSARSSPTPGPSTRINPAPASPSPEPPTRTALTTPTPRATSPDPDSPYSDVEATSAAVQRARGTRKPDRRAPKKKASHQKTKKASESPAALPSSPHPVSTNNELRKRKTAAEANEVFDREYHRASSPPSLARSCCYRCKKGGHATECRCPWSPSVVRDAGSGRLRSVPWTKGPSVGFALERKGGGGERDKGNGGDRDGGKDRKKEKKKKKSKKRRREEAVEEGGEDVGKERKKKKSEKTLRRSSLSL